MFGGTERWFTMNTVHATSKYECIYVVPIAEHEWLAQIQIHADCCPIIHELRYRQILALVQKISRKCLQIAGLGKLIGYDGVVYKWGAVFLFIEVGCFDFDTQSIV